MAELWNLGSVVDNIPSSLSGPQLDGIIKRKIKYVENNLGVTIGSTDIPEQYHLIIVNFAIYDALAYDNISSANAEEVQIAEFKIKKGVSAAGGGGMISAQSLHEQAMQDLMNLKGQYNFFKANG